MIYPLVAEKVMMQKMILSSISKVRYSSPEILMSTLRKYGSSAASYKSSIAEAEYETRKTKTHSSESGYLELYLIPLIAETNRAIPNNKYLFLIQYTIIFLQIFFGSNFDLYPFAEPTPAYNIIIKLLFVCMVGTSETYMIAGIVISCVDLITFLSIVFACLDYSYNHEFRKNVIYLFRIWHGNLYNVFIFPNIMLLFASFNLFYLHKSLIYIFIVIIAFLALIFQTFHTLYITSVLIHSPFLSNLYGMLWRPKPFYMMVYAYAFSCGSKQFFYVLKDFGYLIPEILTIVMSILCFMIFLENPFAYIFSNIFWMSISMPMIFHSVFSIINMYLDVHIPRIWLIVVPLVSFITFIFIMWRITTRKRKKVIYQLSYKSIGEDSSSITEEMKISHLVEFLGNKNMNYAYTTLQIGVEEACDLFLDWSLVKYLTEKYVTNSEMLIFMTWLVSFFPSESSILHSYITLAFKILDISYENKLLFFQLHRVHIFRQSSASKEAAQDFLRIRNLSDNCISTSTQFWKNIANPAIDVDITFIEQLEKLQKQAEQAWSEMLDKYPNNGRFVAEYSRFLLDGLSKFHGAVRWHQKANAIEAGKKMHSDRMFYCFIQMFPHYLKNKIVDIRGCLRKFNPVHVTHQTSSSNEKFVSDDDESDEAIDLDEGNSYLPQMALRFALEDFAKNISSIISVKVKILAGLRMVFILVYIIIVYIMLSSCFEGKEILFHHLTNINSIERQNSLVSNQFNWLLFNVYPDSQVPNDTLIAQILGNTDGIEAEFNFDDDHEQVTFDVAYQGLKEVNQFSSGLYTYSVHTLNEIYSKKMFGSPICDTNASVTFEENSTTIDFIFRSYFTDIIKQIKTSDSKKRKWPANDNFCNIFMQNLNLQDISFILGSFFSTKFKDKFNEFSLEVENKSIDFVEDSLTFDDEGSITLICNIFITFTPFLMLFTMLHSIIMLTAGIQNEQKTYIQSLKTIDPTECLKASVPLESGVTKLHGSAEKRSRTIPAWLLNFASGVIISTLIIAMSLICKKYYYNFDSIKEQYNVIRMQRNLIYDLGRDSIYLVFANKMETDGFTISSTQNVTKFNFISSAELKSRIELSLKRYEFLIEIIHSGIGTSVISIADADNMRYNEDCIPSLHDIKEVNYYKCISFDRLLAYFLAQVKGIVATYQSMDMFSEEVHVLAHMMNSKISSRFKSILEFFHDGYDSRLNTFHLVSIISLVVMFVLTINSFVAEMLVINHIERHLKTFKSLVLKIHPVTFVSSPTIMQLFNNSKAQDLKIMSACQSVFYTANDAMISMNTDGIIEHLNPSATKIFGYTPEQMLGQSIKILINEAETQLFYTMQLMKSGQCSLINETNCIGQ